MVTVVAARAPEASIRARIRLIARAPLWRGCNLGSRIRPSVRSRILAGQQGGRAVSLGTAARPAKRSPIERITNAKLPGNGEHPDWAHAPTPPAATVLPAAEHLLANRVLIQWVWS